MVYALCMLGTYVYRHTFRIWNAYCFPTTTVVARMRFNVTSHVHCPSRYVLDTTLLWAGSSVGIATEYRLDGPGSNPGEGRDFPPVQTGPGVHPASCTVGTGSFPRVKSGRGVLLTTHSLLVPRSWKSRATPLPTLWATPGL